MGDQFFQISQDTAQTTLPTTQLIADETSATIGPILEADIDQTTVPVAVPQPDETPGSVVPDVSDAIGTPLPSAGASAADRTAHGLPVKVDNSSTAAQIMQLNRFERENQIGEAFLLANKLVSQNPDAEYAYDAAVRTSLILGMTDDTERFYQEGIKRTSAAGKFFVQLSHFYKRTGKIPQLQKLISDFRRQFAQAPDFALTLTRMQAIDDDYRSIAGTAVEALRSGFVFPIVELYLSALNATGQGPKAVAHASVFADRDLETWEARTLLLDLLRSGTPEPTVIVGLSVKALANEPDYRKAKSFADCVISACLERKALPGVLRYLDGRIKSGMTDAESFLAARAGRAASDAEWALKAATATGVGSTPLIAYERALLLAEANRTTESLPILENLLAEQPSDDDLRLELAALQLSLNQPGRAVAIVEPVRHEALHAPERGRYCDIAIRTSVGSRDYARVCSVWISLIPKASSSELLSLGDAVLDALGDRQSVVRLQEAANSRMASEADAWPLHLLLARLSSSIGDHRMEMEHYRKFLEHDSENTALLRYAADLAIQYSSTPIQLESSANGSALPVTLHASEDDGLDAAIAFYQRLIALQPRVAEHYSALMRAYQLRGEAETAKRVALELADRGSSTSELCLAAGAILEENGLGSDALAFFREAVKRDPENFSAWMRYAAALRSAGRQTEAGRVYRRILEEGYHGLPYNQPAVISALLAVAHDTSSTEELASYLTSLRGSDIPGKAEFYLSAAKLLMQLKRPDDAESFLTEFQTAFPESKLRAEGLLLLGQLQFTKGDWPAAQATFSRIGDEFTSGSAAITALFNSAEILRQSGKIPEAIAMWTTIAKRFPSDDKAQFALYEGAMSAYDGLQDTTMTVELLNMYVQSDSQDFAMKKRAAESLTRLAQNQAPLKPPADRK